MPPLDDRYVRNLQDFNKALGNIVELLQQDLGKKNVDNVNKMLSNMDDKLNSIVKNMEVVLKSTKKIESQNDKILAEIKANRKAKETGMFGDVADVDNKRKILDAVKVITLIAAGVLAIGMAFKLIAPVNFLSVVAIGLSIVFITGAFVLIAAATEGMTTGDVVNTSAMMVIMAMGLTVSSWALALAATLSLAQAASLVFTAGALGTSLVLMVYAVRKANLEPKDYLKLAMLPIILPLIAIGLAISSLILARIVPMTFAQVMTTIFVATAVGTSLYIMAKAVEKTKIESKDIGKFFLLSVMLPAMALGLVASSFILKGIMPISFGQMISAVFTAVTLGVLVYLMKPVIDKMKEFTLKEIVGVMALVIALSVGLVAASWILSGMKLMSFKDSLLLIMNSLAIGLAVLFITPAVYILKSIKNEDMLKAAVNIVIAAGAIMVSSWLLSLGTYNNVPDVSWALGAGLSIAAYAGTIWLVNKMGLDAKQMFTGAIAVLGISAVIMASSWILSFGNYDEYPSIGWALGVGLTLVAFGASMMILGAILTASGGVATELLAIGALATIGVAATIMATSLIIGLGNYDEYPDVSWAFGVGLSLVAFGGAMMVLGGIIMATGGLAAGAMVIGALATALVAITIVGVSHILNMGSYDEYPSLDWAEGVGLSMIMFGGAMLLLGSTLGIGGFITMGIGALAILIVAGTIVGVSKILAEGDYTSGPTMDWSLGTGAILLAVGMSTILFSALLPFILLGGWSMKKVAETIVEVSNILAGGNYIGGPTEAWAKGVGGSIQAFALGLAALSESDSLLGAIFGQDQGQKIIDIANAMVIANQALSSVSWSNNYPSEGWAKGVGGSILAFAQGMAALDEAGVSPGIEFMYYVATLCGGIIMAAKILNEFEWNKIKNYPSEGWAKGVGDAINAFAKPLTDFEKESGFFSDDLVTGIKKLAKGLVAAAEIINDYDWSKAKNYPSAGWTTGVGNALEKFVKNLVEIEKNDVGRGDLRILRMTIKAMIAAAEDFAELEQDVWKKGPTDTWAAGVGNAMNTFVKYLAEIEKKDIGKGDIRNLSRIISQMIDAAENFAKVKDDVWKKGPPTTWSAGVGEAISTFVKYLIEIEKKDIGKGEIKNLSRIINQMIEAARDFGRVDAAIWKKGPPTAWSTGVGEAIGAFVKYLIEIEKNDLDEESLDNLDNIIVSMIKAARSFGRIEPDVWKKGPSATWSDNVGKAIGTFVNYIIEIEKNDFDSDALDGVIISMIRAARSFATVTPDVWLKGPPITWAEGIEKTISAFTNSVNLLKGTDDFGAMDQVGDAIISFAKKMVSLEDNKELFIKGGIFDTFSDSMKKLSESLPNSVGMADGLDSLGEALLKISSMGTTTGESIRMLAKSMVEFGDALKNVDMSAFEKLSKFSSGIMVLSLIDEEKLNDAISIIDKKRNDIKAILSDNSTVKSKETVGGETTIEDKSSEATETTDRDKFYTELLAYVKNLDANVTKIATQAPKPDETETEEKPVEKPVAGVGSNQTNPGGK